MAPVAVSSMSEFEDTGTKSMSASTFPTPPLTARPDDRCEVPADKVHLPVKDGLALDSPTRRPSPWHDLAHSLSTTSLPHRRSSTSLSYNTNSIPTPTSSRSAQTPQSAPSPPLSTSQALRDWELRLSHPTSPFSRHTLIPPLSSSPSLHSPSPDLFPQLIPKLVPESDKEGYIEYKLKLINPSAERFERLVTQMMWRLKQGRNEAIYELGLADDGTVVGLSRADMDASLHTLELMASEVGATVLVLKEIVLANPVYSSGSFTSAESWTSRDDSPAGWVVPKPKARVLNAKASALARTSAQSFDNPHQPGIKLEGTSGLNDTAQSNVGERMEEEEDPKARKKRLQKVKKKRSWKRRERRTAWLNGDTDMFGEPTNKEKQIVFDPAGFDSSEDYDEEDDDAQKGEDTTDTSTWRRASEEDEDVPPFHLDLEDDSTTGIPDKVEQPFMSSSLNIVGEYDQPHHDELPLSFGKKKRSAGRPAATQNHQKSKSSAKARKAMERREARRLDLLRGDGKTFSPFDLPPESGAMSILPHAPARPSSLRLNTPAVDFRSSISDTSASSRVAKKGVNNDMHAGREDETEENDSYLQDLLSLPLDLLSLSFADVRTITPSSPSASSSSTEYAPTNRDAEEYVETGNERICVEALVVRKVAVEEDEWGWGGDDDAWGLSGDGDGEEGPDLDSVYSVYSPAGSLEQSQSVRQDGWEEVDSRDADCDESGGDDPWGFE